MRPFVSSRVLEVEFVEELVTFWRPAAGETKETLKGLNSYTFFVFGFKKIFVLTSCTGCNDTLATPSTSQPKLKVAQYNKTYCRKVKSISAMDFQYLRFVSIFASFFILIY